MAAVYIPVGYVEVAKRIVRFYAENKGCGHSKAVIEGAARTKANIVVATEAQLERAFKGCKGDKLISLAEIEAGELDKELVKGFPLAMDNAAVVALIDGLLGELDAAKKPKSAETAKFPWKNPKDAPKGKLSVICLLDYNPGNDVSIGTWDGHEWRLMEYGASEGEIVKVSGWMPLPDSMKKKAAARKAEQ